MFYEFDNIMKLLDSLPGRQSLPSFRGESGEVAVNLVRRTKFGSMEPVLDTMLEE